jgi:UDP-N-acetylglucosamine 2-epimerase (non-hydrolysing)
MHPNPNVRRTVLHHLSGIPQLNLVEPVTYRSLLFLLQHACLVLTDSGGIQEEAPSFGVPVLVMREETDRPEAVAAGFAQLVGRDPVRIVTAAHALLRDDSHRLQDRPNPYGDGNAAARVADILAILP